MNFKILFDHIETTKPYVVKSKTKIEINIDCSKTCTPSLLYSMYNNIWTVINMDKIVESDTRSWDIILSILFR